ncbi:MULTISPECIES: sigma-54 dependent transcriptional regulator [unclassified Dysgonomonas]|uniref:sigma-54-dependent transcriptional regulator n=1 Tax=unclassified Dysgonomonas TaxID=2630389 RepID=UPI0025B7A862|nr:MULTISPECIES: sigma-54 dependent transcriptional regulator [unclassified Dysgonomonas]HMM03458.1 sigma-54 dependent transcriptional regulator [Dysgonomonas sp.]
MASKVLIIEDDNTFGIVLKKWFNKNGFDAFVKSTLVEAKKNLLKADFKLIITDLRLPDGDGIMLLTWIRERKINTPVIVMTSYGEVQSAVAAIKLGAFDYMEKPINPDILRSKIDEALNYTPIKIPKENPPATNIVYGNSTLSKQMYEHIKLVAPTHLSVLIIGESGTGKEYTARMIHDNSQRKQAPFVAVDCGSLSKELAPSELFGHLKGSFTSAIADKKGVFEQAGGGTVFLDEVGNLSYEVQVQLLRAIQERKIRPVGSASDIKVDVRMIVATNENLETAISEGRFREDLYHRLNEFTLIVPPLRERKEDIVLFANSFLTDANKELERNVERFSEDSMSILKQYRWPGNLRELRNVIRRTVLFAKGTEITPDLLPEFIQIPIQPEQTLLPADEREQILKALKITKGNKTKAANLLNIDRKTLYNKMHQYGMDI